jgi:hypothetical protein
MTSFDPGPAHDDPARLFLEQILRTGLMLTDLFDTLIEDLPDDTFPGETTAEVLMQMMAGTIRPVALAAGPHALEQATALLGAVGDRTLADLRAAMELTRDG